MASSSKKVVASVAKMMHSKWTWVMLAVVIVLALVWKFMGSKEGYTCDDVKSSDFKTYNFERRRCSKKSGDECKKWKCRKGWEDTGCDWADDKNGANNKYGALQCRKPKSEAGKVKLQLNSEIGGLKKQMKNTEIANRAKELTGDQATLWNASKDEVEWRCPGDDWIWDPAVDTRNCFKPDYDRSSKTLAKNAAGQYYNPTEKGPNRLMVKGNHWGLDKWEGSTCILWHKHRKGQFKGPGRGNIGPANTCTGWNPNA